MSQKVIRVMHHNQCLCIQLRDWSEICLLDSHAGDEGEAICFCLKVIFVRKVDL